MQWPFFTPEMGELKIHPLSGPAITALADDDKPLATGSTGAVCRARSQAGDEAVYAIKFFSTVPQGLEGQPVKKHLEKINEEAALLARCQHPNIVKVVGTGIWRPKLRSLAVPFLAMEYIENGDIISYLKGTGLKATGFIKLLRQIADAMIYLHEAKEYLHADLRVQNILIRENGAPVLVDFSFSKNFNFAEAPPTDFTRARDLVRLPDWLPHDHALRAVASVTRESLKESGFPWVDLYHFGCLLGDLQKFWPADLSAEEEKFLTTLQWSLTTKEVFNRNQPPPDNTVKKERWDARWLRRQLDKLLADSCPLNNIEELKTSAGKEMIQLPGQSIPVTSTMGRLINTRSFNRLRWLNQLSLVDAIYPGATHPRRMHAIRTYGLCIDLMRSLNQSAYFRFFFDERMVKQAVALALLHDINHYPFLHLLQEFKDGPNHEEPIVDYFCGGDLTGDGKDSIFNILHQDLGLEPDRVSNILVLKYRELANKPWVEPGHLIIKSILDSGADIDKMAYLLDDSYFTGVKYGAGVDVGRLIASATVVRRPEATMEYDNMWHLGFRESGQPAVENLVMARLSMYRTVYWNHHNRATMTMIRHVISTILDRLKNQEERKQWFRNYLKETMWMSEEGVLRYLDEQYSQHGHSMLLDLIRTPGCTYERVLTIEGTDVTGRDADEKTLYDTLRTTNEKRPQVIKQCREAIVDLLRLRIGLHKHSGVEIREQDVLFDIPGRVLDWEDVFIAQDHMGTPGASLGIQDLSEAMKALADQKNRKEGMARMSCPVRVFVNPRLVELLSTKHVQEARKELIQAITAQLPGRVASHSE